MNDTPRASQERFLQNILRAVRLAGREGKGFEDLVSEFRAGPNLIQVALESLQTYGFVARSTSDARPRLRCSTRWLAMPPDMRSGPSFALAVEDFTERRESGRRRPLTRSERRGRVPWRAS